ncbi:putative enoyl reductase [Pseudocercospora fuligena]|uniref:very-long-chain enoyl-CoA reductase n=1 Tax=Pseudocercospora fuligena TaxID=685502 RepID=A0A8H6VQ72_9PEZI|nr:putative enoyl reductase [Pseudocercospora fuligena]
MASKPVTLQIKSRGKRISKLPRETSIYIQGSTSDLYHRIAAESKFDIHRLRITTEDGKFIPNDKTSTVASFDLKDGSVIQVKDLGLQIAWQTVFIIEYLGPLLIHPLFYFVRPYIYKNAASEPSQLQTLSCALLTIHFLKRELETIFVHRFSNATMPVLNIFKNSGHYWVLGGLLIAYFIYSPNAPTAAPINPVLDYPAIALFVIGELGNLNTHLVLRGLRSAGGTERGIPKGLGFDWVTCPNYFFEVVAWVGILIVTRHWSTLLFVVTAGATMAVWAQKKERRYRKEFGASYKKKRCGIIPFVV